MDITVPTIQGYVTGKIRKSYIKKIFRLMIREGSLMESSLDDMTEENVNKWITVFFQKYPWKMRHKYFSCKKDESGRVITIEESANRNTRKSITKQERVAIREKRERSYRPSRDQQLQLM